MTPPKHLSKETLIIWESWRKMGSREVIRESAAKGSHVELAYIFLLQRQDTSLENVKSWFKEEVITWAIELLQNKQIFRASHILKNINLDPIDEITNIMLNTSNDENLNFLAAHLDKNLHLNSDLKLHMRLFNIIKNDIDAIEAFKSKCNVKSGEEMTLKMLLNCDTEWKSIIVAKLFLKYYDFTLIPLLSAKFLWNSALESNDKPFLKIWLEVQHSPLIDHSEEDQLTTVLSDLHISDEMFSELMSKTNVLAETKEFVYDTMSKYGKFNSEELKDIQKLLGRISQNNLNENLEEILSQPTANLSVCDFKQQIKEFCIKNDQFIVLDACLQDEDYLFLKDHDENSDKTLTLLKSCKEVAINPNNRNVLTVNLQLINEFLQKTYSNQEEIKETDKLVENIQFQALLKIVLNKFQGNDIQKLLIGSPDILEVLPTIKTVLNKVLMNPPSSNITRYDLIRKHLCIDVESIFRHRFDTNFNAIPNFKCEELVNKYGQHKSLNYASFLYHCRPGKALKLVEKENLNVVEKTVRRLVIKNFQRDDIAAACIYFLDSLNIQTNELKIELNVAKLLHEKRGLTQNEVVNLFMTGKTYEIIKLYEEIMFSCDNRGQNKEFIENYIQLELIINLATHYGCNLPELYLEQLANDSKWIEFLFIIHKFDYPQEQVNRLVLHFKNHALYDHLSHALAHDLVFEPKNALMRDRDARKFFLARIGLLKRMETDMVSSVTSQSSWGSNTSSSGLSDYISEVECSDDNRTDLLQVLIRCHNSNDPPKTLLYACQYYKYPLLAVLATTYEPDSVVTCWLTWLSISCEIEVESCEKLVIVGNHVIEFLQKIVEKGYFKTLRQSICIFLLDNPLRNFLDFLLDCHNLSFNLRQHQKDLEQFSKKLKLRRSNSIPDIDHEMLYLNNKLWIENTAIVLLSCALNNHEKPYQVVQLLKILVDLDLQKYFTIKLPNITNIYNYFNYFYERQITVKLDFNKLFNSSSYNDEIKTFITKMLAENKYEEALKVAKVENILIDEILMKKWRNVTQENQENENYWIKCDNEFKKYNISPENAVNFYSSLKITNELLKYKILTFSYTWCSKFGLQKQSEVELEMWLAFLKLQQPNVAIQIDEEENGKSYLEMKTELDNITSNYAEELSEKETEKLNAIVHKLLNSGAIFQAFRLQKLFTCYSNVNLDIFRLCYALAEGLTLPIQLSAQERLLLRKVKSNRTFSHRRKPLFSFRLSNSTSRSPVASLGAAIDVEPKVQDTLALLESLIEGLTSGMELGERILMTYRISINTNISYNNILLIEDPSVLLLDAMKSNCGNKIEVAHDFFCIYNWNKDQIADFLCEQLITAVTASIKSKQGSNTMWDVNLDQEIHLILQLLPDSCSKLGIKLYSYSSALHKAITITNEMGNTNNLSELSIVIELLILSHECYTYDCNMEGISIILKKCQTLINLLLALKNWGLIVRLLTGVGRYNELNYVFHILRDNDQFEFLLRKGSSKDNGLRVALLDYLKKFCPENRSLYEMVALYFSLYSEVAQLWEAESRQSIKNLIAISKLEMINRKINPDECIFVEFSNTEGTKLCLNKVMENYSHAAEYHLQGEKLAKSMNAAQQAELIALQISLIKAVATNCTTKCILNLTTLQISTLFSCLSFQQALIVAGAFNYQADWAQVLFEHFIVKNDCKYFDNYLMTFNLNDNLVHSISRHYLAKNITSEHGARNMKLILKLLPSIHTQYRIASELGFSDMVEKLLNSDKLNYLKDTVWKRGYRE